MSQRSSLRRNWRRTGTCAAEPPLASSTLLIITTWPETMHSLEPWKLRALIAMRSGHGLETWRPGAAETSASQRPSRAGATRPAYWVRIWRATLGDCRETF